MKSIIRVLRLQWIFFKLSAIADLQMRVNTLVQFTNDVGWYAVQIVLFEALYLHINQLGGWTVADTRVFLGVLFMVDALQMIFFAHNFEMLSEKVSRGDMDLMLLKPASSQQLMTAQRMMCGYGLNFLLAGAWLAWSLSQIPGGLSWSSLLMLLLVVPAGVGIFYSTRLLFSTSALLFSRSEHINELYFSFFRLGLRPDHVYTPRLRYMVLMVIPVGMIASVPARLLVEPFDILLLAGLLTMSMLFVFAAHCFWNWSVRRYCSDRY